MERLRGFRFLDPDGRPLAGGALRLLACLKGEGTPGRAAYLVSDGRRRLLLKVRAVPGLAARLGFRPARSYARREAELLALAGAAGLPVPALVAWGRRRRRGLVCDEGLVVEWIEGHRTLEDGVREAARQEDGRALARAREAVVGLLAAVRGAGLADKDFGSHNVLVPARPGASSGAVWVDLERAYRSPPADPAGTCDSAASLLARWWLASGGLQGELVRAFDEIQARVPEPRGGWSGSMGELNRLLRYRVAQRIALGETDREPAPLEVRARHEEPRNPG